MLKIDDHQHNAPEVLAVGNAAYGLWCRAAGYSAAHLTDGLVPGSLVRQMGRPTEIRRLLEEGMFRKVAPDSFEVVGYFPLNWTRERTESERAAATERKQRSRRAEVTASVTRDIDRDGRRESRPPDQTRPDQSTAVDDYDTFRYDPRDATSSSSVDRHGLDPHVFDAALLLIAEAVTVAKDPARPRGFRHGVLTNLRGERAQEIADRLAQGATAYDLAALEAGGEVYARRALVNLQRPINPIELAQ